MYQQHYYVPKNTGTLTDSLLAFGVAKTVADIVERNAGQHDVIIQDVGSCYLIDTGAPIQEAWIECMEPWEQIRYLVGGRITVSPELEGIATRSVDNEWDRFRQFTKMRQQLSERKIVGDELRNALADLKPRPDWTVATYLGDFRMQAQGGYNVLAGQWYASGQEFLALNLRTILSMFASLTADQDAIAKEWKQATAGSGFKDMVTASQLLNPHMGKGQNRAKANKLSMGNEKSFWLLEYLKAVGLWLASAPRNAQGADLRKNYILAPRRLVLRDHQKIYNRFRDSLWNDTPIKMDVTASLLYTETLLKYSVESEKLGIFANGPVSNLVSGMDVGTYQLLSRNSYTMMNLAFLGLPDWMPQISTFADAQMFLEIIQEHRERIRSIDESRSEGYALLLQYRNFVSGNDLASFFAFCSGYSNYLISELERSHFYVKPFTETNLRRLIEMNQPKLSPILENDGFRNIATAIRRSTVIPQYRGRKTSRFDIRYGLGQDLKRKAQYPDEFVRALADFMQSYNEETVRVYERTKGQSRRKAITTNDIEAVVVLVDEYGSETICNLLVAFGYARDPKEKVEETDNAKSTEEA